MATGRPHPTPRRSPHPARRQVLEWLGSGLVLSLASPLLAACGKGGQRCTAPGETAGSPDSGGPGPSGDGCPPSSFPFEPGSEGLGLYQDWPERTVDPQDLAALLASWKLVVDGRVRTPLQLSFADLLALARTDQVMDFHCVEGWSVLDVPWNGVHLDRILDLAGLGEGATHVTFHTVGGAYNESLPLEVAREPHSLLAFGACGCTLPLSHGFPLRMVVPRLYGYKNPKYVERIELTDHAVEGFWVAMGYPYDGEVDPDRLREGRY